MSDLDVLFPGRDLTAGGQSLTLKPFTFGQLGRAAKLLQPVASSLNSAGIFAVVQINGEMQFRLATDWPMRIIDLLANGGDDLLAFVTFASGQPREWVDALGSDDGISLTKAIMEVNSDFFVRRVLPMLGLVPSDGANLSASSSAPATDAPTSTDTPSDKSDSTSEPSSATGAG